MYFSLQLLHNSCTRRPYPSLPGWVASVMSVIEIHDWAWNCPGQFLFSATVSLPDSIEGNQDIASVRSLDWGEPRILQLGIRKKADQFTTWHVLMVGVRGQTTDNRDYYHEMDVQQVSPGMHMHITLTVELPLPSPSYKAVA